MELEVKGHSGCQIDVVTENGQLYVYKSTHDKGYLKRLKLQGDKQDNAYNNLALPRICVPKIIKMDTTDQSVILKMPYVYSRSFVGFFEHAGLEQIKDFTDALCDFLSYEIGGSYMSLVKADVLKTKFEDVYNKTLSNPHTMTDPEVVDILNRSSVYFNECKDMMLPVGRCHGDLTFSNVLFSGSNYYLIDFLDSFVESPLLDIVKIRQDSAYLWSVLMYSGEYDKIRLSIVAKKIDEAIDKFASQYEWYRHYKLFQLMNFLRILQYAKEDKVISYLKNVINNLLYEC